MLSESGESFASIICLNKSKLAISLRHLREGHSVSQNRSDLGVLQGERKMRRTTLPCIELVPVHLLVQQSVTRFSMDWHTPVSGAHSMRTRTDS